MSSSESHDHSENIATITQKIFEDASVAAKNKFEHHLWYLGPELIPLCLFSEKVSTEAKQKICEAMLQMR